MKRILLLLLASSPFVLFCGFVIWPPDTFGDTRHTLASLRLPDGNSFSVVQYWNHVDFYSTELLHLSPDGHAELYTLDGDDRKRWSVRIATDGKNRIVMVDGYPNVSAPY